jgi:hypothetical protein
MKQIKPCSSSVKHLSVKEVYLSPIIESETIRIESGFAASGEDGTGFPGGDSMDSNDLEDL